MTGHLLEDAPEDALPHADPGAVQQQEMAMTELPPLQQSPTAGLVFPKLTGVALLGINAC